MEKTKSQKCQFPLFLFTASVLVLITWFEPRLHLLWEWVDKTTYLSFHAFFLKTEPEQFFWAVMNSRIGDNFSHALFLSLLLSYIFFDNQSEKKNKSLEALFIIVAIVSSILISKWVQHYLVVKRESPSLLLGHTIALSKAFPHLENIKDASHRSYPGDHGMTLFLLAFFMYYFSRKKRYTVLAFLLALIFSLPRLISGGHWATDILMGSIPIAVFAFCLWIILWEKVLPFLKFTIIKKKI